MERGLHIRNATIVDGSGSAAFAGDVEIEQDHITRVIRRPEGSPSEASSAGTPPRPGLRVIDAA